MLEVRDLEVRIGGARVLDEVSLAAASGELVAVIGPNGAGKSTLCRAIAGDVTAARGEVLLGGRPLAAWPRLTLARHRAYLPQESSLSLPFTVRQVVELGRSPHRDGPGQREIVAAALHALELAGLEERAYPSLSGGEKQRTQLARAFAQAWEVRPNRLLILDEPTTSLDPAHQLAVLELARRWARSGGAVLVTLHDLSLAGRFADRLVVLERGRVVARGAPAEVLTADVLSGVFGLPLCVIPHPVHATPIITPG